MNLLVIKYIRCYSYYSVTWVFLLLVTKSRVQSRSDFHSSLSSHFKTVKTRLMADGRLMEPSSQLVGMLAPTMRHGDQTTH